MSEHCGGGEKPERSGSSYHANRTRNDQRSVVFVETAETPDVKKCEFSQRQRERETSPVADYADPNVAWTDDKVNRSIVMSCT